MILVSQALGRTGMPLAATRRLARRPRPGALGAAAEVLAGGGGPARPEAQSGRRRHRQWQLAAGKSARDRTSPNLKSGSFPPSLSPGSPIM
jgi:hypothetical protein